jgi:hypothetical protein
MIRIKCTRCSRSFDLTDDQIARAVEESRGTNHKHYVVDCPYCRQSGKASLREVRQTYARSHPASGAPAAPAAEAPSDQPAETLAAEASTDQPVETPAAAPDDPSAAAPA